MSGKKILYSSALPKKGKKAFPDKTLLNVAEAMDPSSQNGFQEIMDVDQCARCNCKTRYFHNCKCYEDCFPGSLAIDWMIEKFCIRDGIVELASAKYDADGKESKLTRNMALEIGEALRQYGVFSHLTKRHRLEDTMLNFYHFLNTCPMIPALRGIIKDKSDDIALLNELKKMVADESADIDYKRFEEAKEYFPHLFTTTTPNSPKLSESINSPKLNELVNAAKLNEEIQFHSNKLKEREKELSEVKEKDHSINDSNLIDQSYMPYNFHLKKPTFERGLRRILCCIEGKNTLAKKLRHKSYYRLPDTLVAIILEWVLMFLVCTFPIWLIVSTGLILVCYNDAIF